MRLLFYYIFLMTFLMMIGAMESHNKKRNSDKIEDSSEETHRHKVKKYGKIHANDDSDENNGSKKKIEKTIAKKNKFIDVNENDVSEEKFRKYSKQTSTHHAKQHTFGNDEQRLVKSSSKKPIKNKVDDSTEEDEKNENKQRNKKKQSPEEINQKENIPSRIDRKHEKRGKTTRDKKEIHDDDVGYSDANISRMSRDMVDDDGSEEKVEYEVKKNKHKHQDKNSENKFGELKEYKSHKKNDKEAEKRINKHTKKKFTGEDEDSAEEIGNDDEEEENYDPNQGTKRSMDDCVEVDNSAEECYRSKGKNRRSHKNCESINGESPGDDCENNKKKSKFSIKYAHEKKKNIPTRDYNMVKKIHGIQKKSRGFSDDDDGDSDEDVSPKRLHMLLDDADD